MTNRKSYPKVAGIFAGGVPTITAISLLFDSGIVSKSPVNFDPFTYTTAPAGSWWFHSMRNCPKVLFFRVADSVWIVPVAVVGVERRDTRLRAPRDAPERGVAGDLALLHVGARHVDADAAGHDDRFAVDEVIEVRMHVVRQPLGGLGREPRLHRQLHRIGRRRVRDLVRADRHRRRFLGPARRAAARNQTQRQNERATRHRKSHHDILLDFAEHS